MKSSIRVLLVVCSILLLIQAGGAQEARPSAEIEQLQRELSELRQRVRVLEQQLIKQSQANQVLQRAAEHGRTESNQDGAINRVPVHPFMEYRKLPGRPAPAASPPILNRSISIEEWHRHEMPWRTIVPQHDKGLYY